MVTSRQRSKAKLTHHHTNTDFPGEPGPGDPGPEAPPGIPGREFPGDPKEEIHDWMTNLWAREHEQPLRAPAEQVPLRVVPAEQVFANARELVLRLHGDQGGAGQTAPEGGGAGQTARSARRRWTDAAGCLRQALR